MRRCIRLLYLLTVVLLIPLCAWADFEKNKIAVAAFTLQGDKFDNEDMGTIVAEWFTTAMVREGRFDVVERRMLEKVLVEHQLGMTGIVDTSSAAQAGKLLGVKVIITGSVMKLRDNIEINARIIDVESASIIAAENLKCNAASGLPEMVVEMSRKIIKNFPLEGYVVNRKKDSVILDLGLRTGVKKGMGFIVFKEGQVIKHPKTGEVLDIEHIQTGTVIITNVMHKICKAQISEETTPGAVSYGQQVKSIIDTQPIDTQPIDTRPIDTRPIDTRPKEGGLYVDVSPANARIRIMNIYPVYKRGMILESGSYHLEISAPGYRMVNEWITLQKGEDKTVSFKLDTAPPFIAPSPSPKEPKRPFPTSEQAKCLRLLRSNKFEDQRTAAKCITKGRITDLVVLDLVERVLLKGYKRNCSDGNHIDAMSWLCKALGASGQRKYRSTLKTVANNAQSRKLKGYAKKSLNKL